MNLDRGIVCMDRRSDGISTRTDGPNTLNHQSSRKITPPRYLIHGTVTRNPALKRPYSTSTATSTVLESLPPPQHPRARCRVKSPSIVALGIHH